MFRAFVSVIILKERKKVEKKEVSFLFFKADRKKCWLQLNLSCHRFRAALMRKVRQLSFFWEAINLFFYANKLRTIAVFLDCSADTGADTWRKQASHHIVTRLSTAHLQHLQNCKSNPHFLSAQKRMKKSLNRVTLPPKMKIEQFLKLALRFAGLPCRKTDPALKSNNWGTSLLTRDLSKLLEKKIVHSQVTVLVKLRAYLAKCRAISQKNYWWKLHV